MTRSQQVLPTHSDSLADTTWAPPAQSSMRASAHLASHGAALSRNGGSSASLSLRPRTPGGRAKCRPRTAVRKFSLRGGARLALLCGRARHRQGASARFSAALRVVAFPYPVWQRCMARLAPAACLKPGQAQARMRSRNFLGRVWVGRVALRFDEVSESHGWLARPAMRLGAKMALVPQA